MKNRSVATCLCILVAALVSWSVSGTTVDPSEDTSAPGTAVDLDLTLDPEPLDSDEICARSADFDWSEGDQANSDSRFDKVDMLLNDVDEEQAAIECPGIFYQPQTCSGCVAAAQECGDLGYPVSLCSVCQEVCMCNRGCCF